jgi:hypothetical protein
MVIANDAEYLRQRQKLLVPHPPVAEAAVDQDYWGALAGGLVIRGLWFVISCVFARASLRGVVAQQELHGFSACSAGSALHVRSRVLLFVSVPSVLPLFEQYLGLQSSERSMR